MMRSIAPLLRRQLVRPLDAMRTGSPRLRHYRELERAQWLSPAELAQRQQRRLRDFLHEIYERHPWYRARMTQSGVTRHQLDDPAVLTRLPRLSKAEIRAAGAAMLTPGYEATALLRFKTGGSSGKPLEVWLTEACSERRNALAERHDRWTGWKPGEPIAALWGNPDSLTWRERWRRRLVQPLIVLDTMDLSEGQARRFAVAWQRQQPTLLFGHAHSLFVLAQICAGWSAHPFRPRAVLSTSMMLLAHERQRIEQVFAAPVFDRYGCEEVSLIGSECAEHAGMHLNVDHLVIEFLDDAGAPVPSGTEGRIVVTDTDNLAMPLVRYDVEDVGVPTDRCCPCGRGLPLLERVVGRVSDCLVRDDGTRIAGISLIENTLTRWSGIDQLQIEQRSLRELVLRIVPAASYDPQVEQELIDYFTKLLGPPLTVVIERVRELAPEANGKYRFCISRVNQ